MEAKSKVVHDFDCRNANLRSSRYDVQSNRGSSFAVERHL